MRTLPAISAAFLLVACSEADPPTDTETSPVAVDHTEELAELRRTIADLQTELAEMKAGAITQEDLDTLAHGILKSVPGPTDTSGLSESIAELDAELDDVDTKVGTVDGRVTELDGEVDGVAQSVGALDTKVDRIGDDLGDVESTVTGLGADLTALEDAQPEVTVIEEVPCAESWEQRVTSHANGIVATTFRRETWFATVESQIDPAQIRHFEAWLCSYNADVPFEDCVEVEGCFSSDNWRQFEALTNSDPCKPVPGGITADGDLYALCGSGFENTYYFEDGTERGRTASSFEGGLVRFVLTGEP